MGYIHSIVYSHMRWLMYRENGWLVPESNREREGEREQLSKKYSSNVCVCSPVYVCVCVPFKSLQTEHTKSVCSSHTRGGMMHVHHTHTHTPHDHHLCDVAAAAVAVVVQKRFRRT